MLSKARHGRVERVEEMLDERGADANVEVDAFGNTLLHAAAQAGSEPLARAMITRGADVNCANARGCTPLWYARRLKYDELAAFLAGKGGVEAGSE